MNINHVMMENFVKRWHNEMSSFHNPYGEMSTAFNDVSCLLHLPIRRRLLNILEINKSETLELMVNYLGSDQGNAQKELDATSDAHV